MRTRISNDDKENRVAQLHTDKSSLTHKRRTTPQEHLLHNYDINDYLPRHKIITQLKPRNIQPTPQRTGGGQITKIKRSQAVQAQTRMRNQGVQTAQKRFHNCKQYQISVQLSAAKIQNSLISFSEKLDFGKMLLVRKDSQKRIHTERSRSSRLSERSMQRRAKVITGRGYQLSWVLQSGVSRVLRQLQEKQV